MWEALGIHDAPWDPDQIQLQPIKAWPESDTLSVVEFSSDTSKLTNDPGPARLYMKAVLAKGKTDQNKAKQKQKETTKKPLPLQNNWGPGVSNTSNSLLCCFQKGAAHFGKQCGRGRKQNNGPCSHWIWGPRRMSILLQPQLTRVAVGSFLF